MYLDLFDVILDPLDGVSVDVVANVNLMLSAHLCPDNCRETNTNPHLHSLYLKCVVMLKLNRIWRLSACDLSPAQGLACRGSAATHCCGLDLTTLHVPGAGKTEAT